MRLLQPAEDLGGRRGAWLDEGLAGHHLEQIAPRERRARQADAGGVLARRVIARAGDAGRRMVGRARPLARQSHRAAAVRGEVVAMHRRHLALVVDQGDLVGQVEHQVALLGVPPQPGANRLELEGEVVAERTVKAEIRLVGRGEDGKDGAQQREDGRLAGSQLLGEAAACRVYGADQLLGMGRVLGERLEPGEGLAERRQQHAPARVEGADGEASATRLDGQRRIGKADVPAGIASGILEGRGQQHATMRIERGGQRCGGVLVGDRLDRAVDGDASRRLVRMPLNRGLPVPGGLCCRGHLRPSS